MYFLKSQEGGHLGSKVPPPPPPPQIKCYEEIAEWWTGEDVTVASHVHERGLQICGEDYVLLRLFCLEVEKSFL